MSSTLVFRQVNKYFGQYHALRDFSATIEAGESVGLLGLNGAGKTTLIRSLLDLNRIDGGNIEIRGVPHTQTRARADLSYLAEGFQPPPFATGFELVRYVLVLGGHAFSRAAVCREAEALELDVSALSRPVREYSKGMVQKLGLITCILPKARLLVLDEPMSALDPKARALFRARLGELSRDGTGMFFSTHLLADVETMCDRVLILDQGQLLFDGSVDELHRRYDGTSLEGAFLAVLDAAGTEA